MRRIAYASPVNPAPSGISDYSEELLPYLGRYAEITLYLDDGLKPSNPQLARHLTIRPLSRLARDHRRRRYDALLYHLGNSPVHARIWRALQETPGVVVLHEVVLHHFMLQYYATVRGDIDAYRAEAGRRYGPEGDRIANLMMHGRFTEAAFDYPFCEDVLAAAEGLIAHSRYVIERAAAIRPGLASAHVPMGVPLPPAIERTAARARRGLPQDAPVLASFGHINPYKRVEPALRAVRAMLPDFPGLRYLLVGSVSPNFDLRAAVERTGMAEVVTVTGYVDRDAFEDYVAAADLCLNLRHPTAGETSASLLRLLGAGRPTLVTSSGSFTELPAGVAAQVDPDAAEEDLIQAYCRLLLQRPDLAAAMGSAARDYVAREHTLDAAARGYMAFLARRYGWGDPQPQRNRPLWELEERATVPPAGPVPRPAATPAPATPADAADQADLPLARSLGRALAEIGVTDQDTALLTSAAQTLADLLRDGDAGDKVMGRRGDRETGRPGDRETGRHGDGVTR